MMTDHNWKAHAGTELKQADPCPGRKCAYSGNLGFDNIVEAWSGGAYDPIRKALLIHGGGHMAYFGNEIVAAYLDKPPELISQPSNFAATDGHLRAGKYPDGAPVSAHTYNSLQFDEQRGEFLRIGGYAYSPHGSGGCNRFWRFKDSWQHVSTGPDTYGMWCGYTAYNRVTGKAYQHRENGGRIYEIDGDNWKYIGQKALRKYGTGAMDTKRNRILTLGGKNGFVFDLATKKATNVSVSAVMNASSPGLDYSPTADKFVAYLGGKTLYIIDPETWAATPYTPSSGDDPGPADRYGTNGRFRYMPDSDRFIVLNAVDRPVCSIAIPGSTGASVVPPVTPEPAPTPTPTLEPVKEPDQAPPAATGSDWEARSTAPGVTMATRFDTESEVTDYLAGSTKQYVSWQTDIKTSGKGAMRFDLTSDSTTGHGDWRRAFKDGDTKQSFRELQPGDEVYVSWRQYFPAYLSTHQWKQKNGQRTGFKQAILSCLHNSNTPFEVVVTSESRGYPQAYYQDGIRTGNSMADPVSTEYNRYDYKHQNTIDRGEKSANDRARYGGLYSYKGPYPDPQSGAVHYPLDGWMTFQVRVKLNGGHNAEDNEIDIWAAPDGEDYELIMTRRNVRFGPKNRSSTGVEEGFTALWLLPYTSGGAADPNRKDTFTVYDEVIVSKQFTPAPGKASSTPAIAPVTPPVEPPKPPVAPTPKEPTPAPVLTLEDRITELERRMDQLTKQPPKTR